MFISSKAALQIALGLSLMAMLVGCKTRPELIAVALPPVDYRERHPIGIKEGEHTIDVFIGNGRGTLNPVQRAEVFALARRWHHEATGGIIIDIPVGTANEVPAAEAGREVKSILIAAGANDREISVRSYRPPTRATLGTIKISFPKMMADAGPCGVWPTDIGPIWNREHFENRPYWNLGCATQRNLAAMVDNPADLAQPRGETPAFAAKRSTALDKYRKGESPSTIYPDANKGTISNVAK